MFAKLFALPSCSFPSLLAYDDTISPWVVYNRSFKFYQALWQKLQNIGRNCIEASKKRPVKQGFFPNNQFGFAA
ncbi:MAG: hypothetical protein LUD83_08260 [Clostridiales bacterium]|nr:hypothetical protein [Clostridiales bacterium]